jgi:hypothetical protein
MNQVRSACEEYLQRTSQVPEGAACPNLQGLKPSFSRCFDVAAEAATHKTAKGKAGDDFERHKLSEASNV